MLPRGFRHIAKRVAWRRAMSTTPNPIPATFLRGGTSKGIFINRDTLPVDTSQWPRIFLGVMGSPDPHYGRQLNGMGGGISSLSKIIVVGEPSPDLKKQGVDVEYTFVQVGVRDDAIDYSGNCGNLTSMVGVYAMDEKLCRPRDHPGNNTTTVRLFNTNTGKLIDTTFPVTNASPSGGPLPVLDLPEIELAGVPGKASRIVMDFVSPGGAATGKLLPSGRPVDELSVSYQGQNANIRASLVDATNPTVFVSSIDLRGVLNIPEDTPIDYADQNILEALERTRQAGAVRMGLDPNTQAQPKIAVLSLPNGQDIHNEIDINIQALSMGVLHKAVPLTVGLCLGVASGVKGTIAQEIFRRVGTQSERAPPDGTQSFLRMQHPSGLVDVVAEFLDGEVKKVGVVRTGRRLMKGAVWW